MSRPLSVVVPVVALLITPSILAALPATMSADWSISSATGSHAAVLFVTLDPTESLPTAEITIDVPPGFTVSPRALSLTNLSTRLTRPFYITRSSTAYVSDGKVLINCDIRNGSSLIHLPSITQAFSSKPELTMSEFFLLALIGIAMGYVFRLIINILKDIPRPQPAPPTSESGKPGPITSFVTGHYFLTDFLITVAIGFFALVALSKDGHPPDNAAYWYSALSVGVGLGLLANSELITRVK